MTQRAPRWAHARIGDLRGAIHTGATSGQIPEENGVTAPRSRRTIRRTIWADALRSI